MKRMIVGLLAVCLLGSLTVLAEEKSTTEKVPKKDVEITVTGKLAKTPTGFTVTEADGAVAKVIIKKSAKEGEAAVVDIEQFIGKEVKLVGLGASKTSKAGKKSSVIKTVTSVEEAAAPVAEAPAAAAAPAAPAVAAPAEAPAAPAAEAPAAK